MKKTKVYKNAKAEKAIMESYADLLTMWIPSADPEKACRVTDMTKHLKMRSGSMNFWTNLNSIRSIWRGYLTVLI